MANMQQIECSIGERDRQILRTIAPHKLNQFRAADDAQGVGTFFAHSYTISCAR
jgi:hypothetical protein